MLSAEGAPLVPACTITGAWGLGTLASNFRGPGTAFPRVPPYLTTPTGLRGLGSAGRGGPPIPSATGAANLLLANSAGLDCRGTEDIERSRAQRQSANPTADLYELNVSELHKVHSVEFDRLQLLEISYSRDAAFS